MKPVPQLDLFVSFLQDVHLRDQQDLMERPFFSISKRKRNTEINYKSPNGKVFVRVRPHQSYGMASIWDADILIWAASVLNRYRKQGVNDPPRTLKVPSYELLAAIGRDAGGKNIELLDEAIKRLKSTIIETNIHPPKKTKKSIAGEFSGSTASGTAESDEKNDSDELGGEESKSTIIFSWIDSASSQVRRANSPGRGGVAVTHVSITVSDWFYDSVLSDKTLLSIDPAYFAITGGRERWLYRVARKHAGGNGAVGFPLDFPTLFEKSGAEGTYRRFKFEMLKIVDRDALPGFALSLEYGKGSEPTLRMIRRGAGEPPSADASLAPPLRPRPALTDETLETVRKSCPRQDIYALKADFDRWLERAGNQEPADYQQAFRTYAIRQTTLPQTRQSA